MIQKTAATQVGQCGRVRRAGGPLSRESRQAPVPLLAIVALHGLRKTPAAMQPEPPLRPAPDLALRDRFVQAAIRGNAAHLREDDAAPEAFQRNYARTYQVAVLA